MESERRVQQATMQYLALIKIASDSQTRKVLTEVHEFVCNCWETNVLRPMTGSSLSLHLNYALGAIELCLPSAYAHDLLPVLHGNFIENEHKGFNFSRIPQNAVFFDIGANIGAYLATMNLLNPTSQVVAVEADPRTFKYLQKNIKINDIKNCTAFNNFFDTTNRPVRFQHYEIRSSVSGKNIKSLFGDRAWFNEDYISTHEIRTINYDRILETTNLHPYLVKIDVDGGEIAALRSVLKSKYLPKKIVVEYHTYTNRFTITELMKRAKYDFVGERVERKNAIGNLYYKMP